MPWISIEYRENMWSFALAGLDAARRTLGPPTASQIDSYHHVELFCDVLMCRGIDQLGLSSELAHLQCGGHYRSKERYHTVPSTAHEPNTQVGAATKSDGIVPFITSMMALALQVS